MTTPMPTGPQYTGRQVVVLAPTRARVSQERALTRIAGLASVAHTKDFESQALRSASPVKPTRRSSTNSVSP